MKYSIFSKILNKKIISSLIIICFLTISTNQCDANYIKTEEDLMSYGFIVPSVEYENLSIENQVNCKIRHMVNDLLREKIPVYWMTINMTITIRKIDDFTEQEMFFERGTFIIPFTGNDVNDTKIIAIICDYNQSSEIETKNQIQIPVYELTELLITSVYQLSEVKIAQYKSWLTTGESWYLDAAEKGGFLNFKIINDCNISKELNNDAYDLIIWPGYEGFYDASYGIYEFKMEFFHHKINAIRKFVKNGGGFVGSCYALGIASRGYPHVIVYPKIFVRYPILRPRFLLVIMDIIASDGKTSPYLEECIVNHNHPVVYGIDEITVKGFTVGPTIGYAGKDVNIIANFKNDTDLEGKPSCVSSYFGKGKVVLFSPHYEIRDPDTGYKGHNAGIDNKYNSKKFIINAFYYLTTKEIIQLNTYQSRNIFFISDVRNRTVNLTINPITNKEIFNVIKSNINTSILDIYDIIKKINNNFKLKQQVEIEKGIDINDYEACFYFPAEYLINYTLVFYIKYLNNTVESLNTLEKIYPLLEEDEGFIQKIEILKSELTANINNIQNKISKCKITLQDHENLLLECQNSPGLTEQQRDRIDKAGHEVEVQIAEGFYYLPQIYFNSLKLLRNSWYNYEAGIEVI